MRNHFKAVWTEDRLPRAAGVWPFGALLRFDCAVRAQL